MSLEDPFFVVKEWVNVLKLFFVCCPDAVFCFCLRLQHQCFLSSMLVSHVQNVCVMCSATFVSSFTDSEFYDHLSEIILWKSTDLSNCEFAMYLSDALAMLFPANIVVQGQYWSDTSGCTGPIWQACTGPVTFCTQAPLWPCTVCLQWTCTELYWANTEHVDNHDMGFIHYFCIGPVQ